MFRRRITAWALAAAAGLVLLLWSLNVPFYSGASIGRFQWRMEHGRVKVWWRVAPRQESFYIAGNSEGLKWAGDAHFYPDGSWFVTVPLWCPFVVLAGASAGLFALKRHPRGCCRGCGYELRGLVRGAACPECGRKAAEP
jgi:hypothetical protein